MSRDHFIIVPAMVATASALVAACDAKPGSSPSPDAPPPAVTVPATAAATAGFERTLELQGITFRVSSTNDRSLNQLRIVPAGLSIDNTPIAREVEGTVTGAQVADLDRNGSPEVYVYVQSAGSGSYGSLVAYAANNRKSLSEIYLPPVTDNPAVSKGYMGHDNFAVTKDALVRRFPVYREHDSNAQPTGGTRQLRYKLTPGEAGWVLQLDPTVND